MKDEGTNIPLPFSPRNPSNSTLVGTKGKLYTVSYDDGIVYALDVVTGKIDWRTPLHVKPFKQFVVSHGMIFVTSEDSFLYALKASDGQLLWKHSIKALAPAWTEGGIAVPSSLVCDGNVLYFGVSNGIYAWRASDGRQLWYHMPPACDPIAEQRCERYVITVNNGIVYVYFTEGLYALRSMDGTVLWQDQRVQFGSDLFVIKDHLYVVSYEEHAVSVLRADNGLRLDTIPLPQDYPIQILATGETIYIVSGMHNVYTVQDSDLSILWQKYYAESVRLVTADEDNLYYVVSVVSDSNLKPNQASIPTKAVDFTLNMSSQSGLAARIYAVNAIDGSFRWYWQSPLDIYPGIVQAPAVGSYGGMLYFALQKGVYALQVSDGKMVWRALSNKWLMPPIIE